MSLLRCHITSSFMIKWAIKTSNYKNFNKHFPKTLNTTHVTLGLLTGIYIKIKSEGLRIISIKGIHDINSFIFPLTIENIFNIFENNKFTTFMLCKSTKKYFWISFHLVITEEKFIILHISIQLFFSSKRYPTLSGFTSMLREMYELFTQTISMVSLKKFLMS